MRKQEGVRPEYAKHARRFGKRRANKGNRRWAKMVLRRTPGDGL